MSLCTRKNVCQRSHLLVKLMLNRAVMGIFRSKIEVKSSKSLCRGNFLFVPFNLLFYVWTMRQCVKNIPARFQSRPTFLAGSFSKRVMDDDDRRKTFFLASCSFMCSEYSSLIYSVVTMEYRTSDRSMRAFPVSSDSSVARYRWTLGPEDWRDRRRTWRAAVSSTVRSKHLPALRK